MTNAKMKKEQKHCELTGAIGDLIWGHVDDDLFAAVIEEQEAGNEPQKPKKRGVSAVGGRPVVSNKPKTPSKNDDDAPSNTRRSSKAQMDKHGNMTTITNALGSLIQDKTGNSESGASYLRRLVKPSADDLNNFEGCDFESDAMKRSEFDPEPSTALLAALKRKPERRTYEDMQLINRFLGWHPVFNVGKGAVKQRMLRQVELVSLPPRRVVVLQNDVADSAYIVYAGKLAVHSHQTSDAAEMQMMRKNQQGRARIFAREIAKTDVDASFQAQRFFGQRLATLTQSTCFGENGIVADSIKQQSVQQNRNATIATLTTVHLFRVTAEAVEVATGRSKKQGGDLLAQRGGTIMSGLKPGGACSFAGAPHAPLLAVLGKPALSRSTEDVSCVARHCGWQPFFLSADDEDAVNSAYRHLRVLEFEPNQTVCVQGDLADCYFIVYRGTAQVFVAKNAKTVNRWKGLNLWVTPPADENPDSSVRIVTLPLKVAGDRVATMEPGMAFGENGLDPSPGDKKRRSATVVAASSEGEPLVLLALYRDDIDCRKKQKLSLGMRGSASLSADAVRRLSDRVSVQATMRQSFLVTPLLQKNGVTTLDSTIIDDDEEEEETESECSSEEETEETEADAAIKNREAAVRHAEDLAALLEEENALSEEEEVTAEELEAEAEEDWQQWRKVACRVYLEQRSSKRRRPRVLKEATGSMARKAPKPPTTPRNGAVSPQSPKLGDIVVVLATESSKVGELGQARKMDDALNRRM